MNATASESPASLAEILAALRRSALQLAAFVVGGIVLALLALAVLKPRFQSRASILIEQEAAPGYLGDLAVLATLASTPAAASELEVLESRTLAEGVLAEGSDSSGAWNPRDERRVGLSTWVDDSELRPLSLFLDSLFEPAPPDRPPVLPPRQVLARVTHVEPEAPARLRVWFPAPALVHVETASFWTRLGLGDAAPVELAFVPRQPIEYRGLTLELEAEGDFVGHTFALEHRPEHEALDLLRQRIQVRETALNSGVIEVLVEDSDPRRAQRTVAALVASYLDELEARGQRRASRTVEYVQSLLEQEFTRFDSAQERLMKSQEATPELLAPEGAAETMMTELSTLEVERAQLDLSRRAFDEVVAALEQGDARALSRVDSNLGGGVLVDPVTSGFLTEIARLEAQYETLNADLLPDHPLLRENRAALTNLLARTRVQLADRSAGFAARSEELGQRVAEVRQRMAALPEGVRELAVAGAELEIHRELVPYLIKFLQGAEMTRSGAEQRAELLDAASAPSDIAFPDPVRTLAAGALLGLFLGCGWVILAEPRRGRVHSAAELGRVLEGATVIELPGRVARGTSALLSEPGGRAAESLRALRAALWTAGTEREAVAVVPLGRSGLARIAAELATGLALEGRRTLLVEADLRAPSQSVRLTAAEPGPGLAAFLSGAAGDVDWRTLVRPTSVDGLEILPAGNASASAGDLLRRPAFARLVAEARQSYDAVVLDLPPPGEASETPTLAALAERTCLAVRARALPRRRVAAAWRTLGTAGVRGVTGALVGR